jgi:hypothetical protein
VTAALQHLIAEARGLANDHPCTTTGHLWQSDGGRECPRSCFRASQAVYRCARCGEFDYGEPGGPGYRDCFERGPCDVQDEGSACD